MTKIGTSVPLGLPGISNPKNRGTISWKHENLVAVGSSTKIVLVNPKTLEILQILEYAHLSPVNRVIWNANSREIKPEKTASSSHTDHPDLVSTDTSSTIFVWDVSKGAQLAKYVHPEGRTLIQTRIFAGGADHLRKSKLLLLYSGNHLVLFDLYSFLAQTISVSAPLDEEFADFDFNPFSETCSEIALITFGGDSVSLLSSFDPLTQAAHQRVSPSKKISVESKKKSTGLREEKDVKRHSSSASIRKLMSDIVGVETSHTNISQADFDPSKIPSIQFHPNIKDAVIVSNHSKILLLDIQFGVVLSRLLIETNQISPLIQIIPSATRPAIFTLHENGVICLRKYSFVGHHNLSIGLETICVSDNPRLGKKSTVLAAALDPNQENRLLISLSDGRFVIYEVHRVASSITKEFERKKILPTPVDPNCSNLSPFPGPASQNVDKSALNSSRETLCGMLKNILSSEEGLEMRFKLKRASPLIGSMNCVKAYEDFFVAGTTTGFLLEMRIGDDLKTRIVKRLSIHGNSPVTGIEFINKREVLSFANLSYSTNPKCELAITELETGNCKLLKPEDPAHIMSVKVSPLSQYFIVIFKNALAPSELWDVGRKQLIKTLPTKLPPISCVEWKEPNPDSKEETFYMTDLGSFLFTFRVEGNRFSSATCVKLEIGNLGGIPIGLFTVGEYVFRADSSGSLVIYNTEKKTANPGIIIGRGPLHKVEKCNNTSFVAMFSDFIEFWDFENVPTVKKIRNLHQDKLRAIDMSISSFHGILSVISKTTGSLKYLSLKSIASPFDKYILDTEDYPTFSSARAKCLKIYECLHSSPSLSTEENIVNVLTYFGLKEEVKFLALFLRALKLKGKSDEEFEELVKLTKEIHLKTAQAVYVVDVMKREEVSRSLLLAGECDKAAELLLDTEPSDPKFYLMNGLKASITVGSQNLPESTKAVLKIVATNLIASGDLDEGLELLCTLSKQAEACKYLESSNNWKKALLICRTSLYGKTEGVEMLNKYANHLNVNRAVMKSGAVYIEIGKLDRALEVIFGSRKRHLAYVLLFLSEKAGVSLKIGDHVKLAIRLDFARLLFEAGCVKESLQFCQIIGDEANDLKSEIEILSG